MSFPDILPELKTRLPQLRGRLMANQSLAELTWFRVGGPAQVLFVPEDEADLAYALGRLPADVPVTVVGLGSNLIVRDGGVPGVVIRLGRGFGDIAVEGTRVRVGAAVPDVRVARAAQEAGVAGLAFMRGIPGAVGGALRMNAGAYGTQIGSYVREVELYRAATAQIETLRGNDIRFDYRHTSFAPDDVMLRVKLELPSKPYKEILAGIKVCNEKRRASQPLNQKSAGCIFKNPPGGSAGRMIDELKLKGHRVGDAAVSDRHANFFVNLADATCDDMRRLIDDVRERVRAAYGVELENEVIFWRN